jgi:hypothetical protein
VEVLQVESPLRAKKPPPDSLSVISRFLETVQRNFKAFRFFIDIEVYEKVSSLKDVKENKFLFDAGRHVGQKQNAYAPGY